MKLLIAYDSGYGATAQMAGIIGQALKDQGAQTEVCSLGSVLPDDFEVQIVGSPLRIGRVTPRVRRHLKATLDIPTPIPTALFLSCMTVKQPEWVTPYPLFVDPQFRSLDSPPARLAVMENNHTAAYYLNALSKHLYGSTPLGVAFLRGRLHMAELSFWHGAVMRLAKLVMPEIQDGDFADQTAARTWVQELYPGILKL